MLDFEITKNTRDLLADLRHWGRTEVRPRARQTDDNYDCPDDQDVVAARAPITHCPLEFWYTGPGVRGHETDTAYNLSLNGGRSFLGLLCSEEIQSADGWGTRCLPGNNLGERAIRLLGDAYQIERWAEGIYRGDYKQTAICMTEEHCGLDLAQVRTTATQSGDKWILNGSKYFISYGVNADYLVVAAQTEPGSGLKGIRAFIVERGDEGLGVTNTNLEKMGTRYFKQSAIEFNNIVLDENRVLARGFGPLMGVMNETRPFCAAGGVGTARGMLEYAEERVRQHDMPLSPRRRGRFEDVVAEMHAALGRARRMILEAGWVHDQGQADALLAHKCKAYAAPIFQAVAFRAMQLMGPEAWSKEHLMEKWYRDIKFYDIIEGTGNSHRIAIGRAEYGRPAGAV